MKKNTSALPGTPSEFSKSIDEIFSVFETKKSQVKVLSLDCFDTLLWRRTTKPTDVFQELQQAPAFQAHGITASSRRMAERKCRLHRISSHRNSEVTLEEIYKHLLPLASNDTIAELVNLEITFEKKYLFAFEPMFRLLQKAKDRGLRTILVSDMYINAHQLEELVRHAAARFSLPVAIDHFFTSADFRHSKKEQLFSLIAKEMQVLPEKILHFGDHPVADMQGPRKLGVQGYHFNRFSPAAVQILSQAATMQKLLVNDHGEVQPLTSTVHAGFTQLPVSNDPIENLGLYQVGPVLAQYAYWLDLEIRQLLAEGKKPRLAFMMRDGFLPLKIHEQLGQRNFLVSGVPVVSFDISRFVALAAHFKSKQDIHLFLQQSQGMLNRAEMLRQLISSDALNHDLRFPDVDPRIDWEQFVKSVLAPDFSEAILRQSQERQRQFTKYLQSELMLQAGETLVLADLGYAGTIQDQIHQTVEAITHCPVEGRYFLLRDSDRAPRARKGLIDFRQVPVSSIELLLSQIQTLEQFCTNDRGSLLAYTPDGKPVFEENTISEQQIQIKKAIQAAALRYIEVAYEGQERIWNAFGVNAHEAIGHLARFTLKPNRSEITLYSRFNHDINNGTQRARRISNPVQTREMLMRGAGMSFNADVHKMIGNDLNACDPSLVYQNFLQKILGFRAAPAEYVDHFIKLKGLVMKNGQHREIQVPSFRTYDGFKLAVIPNIENLADIGINFGHHFSWVQFKSIALASQRALLTDPGWRVLQDMDPDAQIEGGIGHENGIVQFQDANGFMYINLKNIPLKNNPDAALVIQYRDIAAQSDRAVP